MQPDKGPKVMNTKALNLLNPQDQNDGRDADNVYHI